MSVTTMPAPRRLRRTAAEAARVFDELRAMLAAGLTHKEISRATGLGVQYVHKAARKAGLRKCYLSQEEFAVIERMRGK